MAVLDVHVNGDGVWPDMKGRPIKKLELVGIAALPGGMQSGNPSVMLRLEADGQVYVAEVSLRLFQQANAAFRGRYGDI